MSNKKQVVVVGGGGAGADVARALSQQLDSTKHELTLISAHPYSIWFVASLRMLVTDKGSLEKQMLIPYDKLFVNGNGTFKQGVVTEITGVMSEKGPTASGKVILQDGESVNFDILVLATGSKWESFLNFPFDAEKVREHIKEWRTKFGNAKKIVIAGGGPVGIELSGELRHFYPDTEVTLVHSDEMLLGPAFPDKFRLSAERRARACGVKLILDDYLDAASESTIRVTRKGVELEADLVVTARGGRPNTSWIISSLGKQAANEHGYLHIKPTMQLVHHPNIFALGDITDFPEPKQVGKYPVHADVVASNVAALARGAEPRKKYKGQAEIMVLTLGMATGTSYFGWLWGLMFGNWTTSLIKGKGLLISMKRKRLGYSG